MDQEELAQRLQEENDQLRRENESQRSHKDIYPDCGAKVGDPFRIESTILDITRRADAIQPEYDAILSRIRNAPVLYVDETPVRVQGKNHCIWVFTTPTDAFFVVRNSRGMKGCMEDRLLRIENDMAEIKARIRL
jgi:hypothetical protein